MASATLREIFATHVRPVPAPPTVPTLVPVPDVAARDYDWVYDDPDLAPFLASRRERKETPLEAFG